MDIILFRHGHAIDDTGSASLGDAGRWLSGKGRERTRSMGQKLFSRKKRRPAEIWTSPLVRAVQTAEIVAGAADLSEEVYVRDELSPGRDPAGVIDLLAVHARPGPVMLVGHEPSLSILAAMLLGERSFPELKKSGALGLSWEGKGRGPAKVIFERAPKL